MAARLLAVRSIEIFLTRGFWWSARIRDKAVSDDFDSDEQSSFVACLL